jgi:Ca-activated chloride channel homolog
VDDIGEHPVPAGTLNRAMKFARIEMLFLIWAVPLLCLAWIYGWRRRRRILRTFAAPRTLAGIVPAGITPRRRWGAVLALAAALCLATAMSGPQYGFHWQEVERRGVDIVIALDCSRSMLATDIQPNRLDRAKREIYDLLTMLEGDRVGLTAFSGTAFLQCPLTIDYQAFNLFLEVLTPDYLPVGGTDLAAALRTAQGAFDPKAPAEKAVILITDGENTGPDDPLQTARDAQKAGIKLFCIGVGSNDGVPVPAAQGGFKKDATGRIVLSRLDESLLTRMALATGGGYVRSVAGDMDLDTIYREQIRGHMKAATVHGGRKQVWSDRFQWPLALAVLFMFIIRWMPSVKKAAAVLLLLTLITAPAPARAGPLQQGYQAYQKGDYPKALKKFIDGQLKDPDNPEVLYNIGNAYYKNGDFAAAQDHFSQALSRAPDALKAKLLYNLGNSAYRQGQMEEAAKHYEAALKLTPEDRQAKENLAFVKQRMEQQKQQKRDQKQNQDQKKQQKNETPDQQADQNEGRQNQTPKEDQDNQQNKGRQQNAKEPDQNQPAPQYGSEMKSQDQNPAAQDEKEGRQHQAASAGKQQKEAPPGQPSAGAQMLNRLKDQPGRALMPRYEQRQTEKDW